MFFGNLAIKKCPQDLGTKAIKKCPEQGIRRGRYVPVARVKRRIDQAGRRDPAEHSEVGRFLISERSEDASCEARYFGVAEAKSRSDFERHRNRTSDTKVIVF